MKEVDFEIVNKIFQDFYQIDTISHCDILEVDENEIRLIEKTLYINKNLLDPNIYNNELAEIVKKMWGSFSILMWYLEPTEFRKRKVFILRANVDPRFARILSKLNREIKKFKNGAYIDIKLDIVLPT